MSEAIHTGIPRGAYPERQDQELSWLDETGERASGWVRQRLRFRRARGRRVVALANDLASEVEGLGDAELLQRAAALRVALRRDGLRQDHVALSFALVRAVAMRRLGQRHYDVQLLGAWAMLQGAVAEMDTGEGKTLTATLAAGTAALAGLPVHVITVNDYLVERDAHEMQPVYAGLGLSVGAIQGGMSPDDRRAQYASDVTYCSNKELAFDYLKDRIALGRVRSRLQLRLEALGGRPRSGQLLLRGLCFGIVDEADSVLVDEARTPLIISAVEDCDELERQTYETGLAFARRLEAGRDFRVDPRERSVRLTEPGEARLESLAAEARGVWRGARRREELVTQALSALHLFERDLHYLVRDDKVQIIDEYTGRVMPDRSWERGLHQMIEAKEGCPLTGRKEPLARISYQRFFRRYLRLAGMSGTAREVSGELWSVYRLPVVPVPTHRPRQRHSTGDRVFASADARWRSVVERIGRLHGEGRPVLVGTRSVEASEHLSGLLDAAVLPHQVLNARQDREEAEVVAEAGRAGRITVATNMAGRGTDIRLAPEAREAGGLHVLATERHEARRIDRQLFGRCGRQGDPGSYETLVCLEDEVVRSHGGLWWRLATAEGGAWLRRPWLQRALVRHAQRRAERLHSRIRRQLLKADAKTSSLLAFSGRGE